jgi:hypothetical protein
MKRQKAIKCEICGRTIDYSYHSYTFRNRCASCLERVQKILYYHSSSKHVRKMGKSKITFGFELELVNTGDEDFDSDNERLFLDESVWKYFAGTERDCSIPSGVEFVSNYAGLSFWRKNLEKALDYIKYDFEAINDDDNTCGNHITIGGVDDYDAMKVQAFLIDYHSDFVYNLSGREDFDEYTQWASDVPEERNCILRNRKMGVWEFRAPAASTDWRDIYGRMLWLKYMFDLAGKNKLTYKNLIAKMLKNDYTKRLVKMYI